MITPEWTGVSALVLVLMWFLCAALHQKFIPSIKTSTLRDRVEFISRVRGVAFNSAYPLPRISFLEQTELFALIPEEDMWEFAADDFAILGLYFKTWNHLFLDSGTREDTFIHELDHYVQHTYLLEFSTEKEKDREAWRMTRIFLQSFYPLRYRVIMILYGFLGIWGYDIMHDRMYEYVQQ